MACSCPCSNVDSPEKGQLPKVPDYPTAWSLLGAFGLMQEFCFGGQPASHKSSSGDNIETNRQSAGARAARSWSWHLDGQQSNNLAIVKAAEFIPFYAGAATDRQSANHVNMKDMSTKTTSCAMPSSSNLEFSTSQR